MTARAYVLAGVPVLIAAPPATTSVQRPAVLWMHGFRADALAHAAELEHCAELGFVAVGVDAVHHGARGGPQLNDRLRRSETGALPIMLDVVEDTLHELPALVDELVVDYQVDRVRVSMVGISMGAFLAYRAIASGVPLRSVVALLGSPEWPGDTSAHRSLMAFRDVALLSITAEHDLSVPPAAVHRLHDALDARTNDSTPRHHYELRGSGHLTTDAHWADAMRETMAWLHQHAR